MVFLNDEYCHFSQTITDIDAYCDQPTHCRVRDAVDRFNMRTTKTFTDLMKQMFKSVLMFKDETWSVMSIDSRGAFLTTWSHSLTQLLADILDIKLPLKIEDSSHLPDSSWYTSWSENIVQEIFPQNAIYNKTMEELEGMFDQKSPPEYFPATHTIDFELEIKVDRSSSSSTQALQTSSVTVMYSEIEGQTAALVASIAELDR